MQWIDFQQTIDRRLTREQLDEQQAKVRNFNSSGHALVRGVAGSGKSLVLSSRVERVIEEGLSPVLVLSYNRFMRGWLESKLSKNNIEVDCSTFHKWAYKNLGYSYQHDEDASLRKQMIERAKQSTLKYQAIFIDEAQDFYDEWFQAILEVLDDSTNSLFLAYDNTQSVYGQSHRRKSGWRWSSLGFKIPGGRSQILDVNYRNSPEILELAWQFIRPSLDQAGMLYDKRENNPAIDRIIEPKKKLSRSSGIKPSLFQVSLLDMPSEIARQVQRALESHPESSVGVLTHPSYPKIKSLRRAISQELNQLGIHNHAPTSPQQRHGNVVDRPCVIVDSWNALKGVEFDAVIIAGADLINDSSFEENAGIYTAMTRARDHLAILYQDKNSTVNQIESVLNSPDLLESVE